MGDFDGVLKRGMAAYQKGIAEVSVNEDPVTVSDIDFEVERGQLTEISTRIQHVRVTMDWNEIQP